MVSPLANTLRSITSTYARLRAAHPAHWHIASGMAWVGFFGLIGGLVVLAKDVAIAYRYGVSGVVDAYIFVFNLLTWLPSLWTSVLTVVLVPLLAQLAVRPREYRTAFRAELTGVSLAVGGALVVLTALAFPLILTHVPLGMSPATMMVARDFSFSLAPLLLLGVLSGLASTRLLALKRHSNTLFQCIPALTLLIAVPYLADRQWRYPAMGNLAWFCFPPCSVGWSLILERRPGDAQGNPPISRLAAFLEWDGRHGSRTASNGPNTNC